MKSYREEMTFEVPTRRAFVNITSQVEAALKDVLEVRDDPKEAGPVAVVVVRVLRIHADETLIVKDEHIDPTKWEPLIYNFRHYYGLGEELGKTFKAEV